MQGAQRRPTVHLVFSVQEEFNLRGAVTAAQALQPDIAIQLDLHARHRHAGHDRRAATCGSAAGPAMSMYSFHGRGTLNGTIPHPALVALFDSDGARREKLPLQRSAHIGALTDSSYVQLVGEGVAAIDLGFPDALHAFVAGGLRPRRPRAADAAARRSASQRIDADFSLDRDDFIQ